MIPRTLRPFNVFLFNSAQRLDSFAWCVSLCRLLVGFRTHLRSMHFHFITFLTTIAAATAAANDDDDDDDDDM